MRKVKKTKKAKQLSKPSAVRKTVVDFCKLNQISVREFVNHAKRTRLATTKDAEKMKQHLALWTSYGWIESK